MVQTKRPLDMAVGGPRKKSRGDDAEFELVAAQLAPVIGQIIDSYGGVCSYSIICTDDYYKQIVENAPKRLNVKAKRVVAMYTEYIVPLADGYHVATALGYENNIVSEDGIVDKTLMKQFWDQKKTQDKLTTPKASYGKTEVVHSKKTKDENPALTKLKRVLDKLRTVGLQDNEDAFEESIMEARAARDEVYRIPAPNTKKPKKSNKVPDLNSAEARAKKESLTKADKEPFAMRVRQVMVDKGCTAYETIKINSLSSDTEAQMLHQKLGGSTVIKMVKILEEYSDWFCITQDEENKALTLVSLTNEGADLEPSSEAGQPKAKSKNKTRQKKKAAAEEAAALGLPPPPSAKAPVKRGPTMSARGPTMSTARNIYSGKGSVGKGSFGSFGSRGRFGSGKGKGKGFSPY